MKISKHASFLFCSAMSLSLLGCDNANLDTPLIDLYSVRSEAHSILIDSPDPESRWRAIRIIAATDARDAIPDVIASLKSEFPIERSCAARALGDMKATSADQPLLETLKNEQDENVIQQTSLSLVNLGVVSAVGLLKTRISDVSEVQTKTWLLRAIITLGGRSEIEYVASYLSDPLLPIRSTAAESIGDLEGVDFGFPKSGPYNPELSVIRAQEWWQENKLRFSTK